MLFCFLRKPHFSHLLKEEEENRVLSLSKSLFVCLFDCNQFQPFSQSNREGVSSSLTNAKNHTFLSFILEFHQLLRTSRFQTSFHISPFQQSSNQKEEESKTNSKHTLQMRLRFRSFRPI